MVDRHHSNIVYVLHLDILYQIIHQDLYQQSYILYQQILKIYQDKKQVLETPVVTGKNSTPSDIGLFEIFSKEKDRYLNGPGYSTHVNYFMPYNGGEGLHDATWRSEFGGDIYKYSGSHGCINMPLDKAAEAYEYLSVDDKVLVKK